MLIHILGVRRDVNQQQAEQKRVELNVKRQPSKKDVWKSRSRQVYANAVMALAFSFDGISLNQNQNEMTWRMSLLNNPGCDLTKTPALSRAGIMTGGSWVKQRKRPLQITQWAFTPVQ